MAIIDRIVVQAGPVALGVVVGIFLGGRMPTTARAEGGAPIRAEGGAPGVVRASKLEIVDSKGIVRARIGIGSGSNPNAPDASTVMLTLSNGAGDPGFHAAVAEEGPAVLSLLDEGKDFKGRAEKSKFSVVLWRGWGVQMALSGRDEQSIILNALKKSDASLNFSHEGKDDVTLPAR
jgi:hypothetical protein